MITYIISLFFVLFRSCLNFSDIFLFITACAVLSVLSTIFVYILRGRY